MPLSDPLEILLEHDRWATSLVIAACEPLTGEQFARSFPMGFGSLQATLEHVIRAMATWTDTLEGRAVKWPPVPEKEGGYSAAELMKLHEGTSAAFAAAARKRPLDEVVRRVRQGRKSSFTRGAVVTHVATHGTHHRAQCLNMLRQLGVSVLPVIGVADWSRDVDFPAGGG